MAEGIDINSQSGSTQDNTGSGVASAIGFIIEFNQNATNFNQIIGKVGQ
ncbi:MAG: hypothetical protein ACFE0Q_08990 [Anaerolineae bacterium]